MKTILYQPLFINPQAYFVFPQLYHIEKGDSYIEPANITGQLIINDLTKVLTSTPTLNVVQDTNFIQLKRKPIIGLVLLLAFQKIIIIINLINLNLISIRKQMILNLVQLVPMVT